MSKDLKNTIIGGVAVWFIITFFAWITDSLPSIWKWFQNIVGWVWDQLTIVIHIPLGILTLLVCLAIVFLFRFWSLQEEIRRARDSSEVIIHRDEIANAERDPDLDDLEIRLLRIFAKADGRQLSTEFLPQQMGLNRLRTEKVLQGLYGQNLIDVRHNYIHGTRFYLTPRGRDFVIKHGLDASSKQA